jgi:hypothetical protein
MRSEPDHPQVAISPALALLQILADVNNVQHFGTLATRATGNSNMPLCGGALLPFLTGTLFTPHLTSDFTPIVESLKSIHMALEAQGPSSSHQFNRELHGLETTLRDHAIAVDRLLGYRASGEPSKPVLHALQQTLFLQCPRGGKTAGRFRVVNRTGKRAYVDFHPCPCRPGEDGMISAEADLAFEPNRACLESDEAAIFRALVDLSNGQQVTGTLEMSAGVWLNSELTLRLFIYIEVYE